MLAMKQSMKKQCGYVVLTTAAIILLGTSISALFTARTAATEQRVTANDYRAKQSFEAGEAGVEYGIAHLYDNKAAVLTDANNDGFLDAYSTAQTSSVALNNNTVYTITYSNPIANDFDTLQVMSTGGADNNQVNRTITQLVHFRPFIVQQPPAPLIAKDNVDFSGDLTVANTETGLSIWSGGATTLTGSAETDGGNGVSSDKNGLAADVQQNDAGLTALSDDQFFKGFFGMSKDLAKEYADIKYVNSSNTNYSDLLNGVTNKIVWIDQSASGEIQFSGNSTIGSPGNPVVIIAEGDFKANGNTTLYGLIYVMGDWINDGGGTLDVNGAVIVEGSVQSNGTPNVVYTTPILGAAQELGNYTKVPGSWRDF